MLLKIQLLQQLKIYSGIDFSVNGWTLLLGAKIAGVKLLLPWTGVENLTVS